MSRCRASVTTMTMTMTIASMFALVVPAMVVAQTPSANAAEQLIPEKIPAQVDGTFAAWDLDHDGALSLQEFRNGWLMLRRRSAIEVRLQRQFQAVDRNHDGGIDGGEFAQLPLVKAAGKDAPALSTFDANSDQRLNFAEYADLVRHLSPKPPRAAEQGRKAAPMPVRK